MRVFIVLKGMGPAVCGLSMRVCVFCSAYGMCLGYLKQHVQLPVVPGSPWTYGVLE